MTRTGFASVIDMAGAVGADRPGGRCSRVPGASLTEPFVAVFLALTVLLASRRHLAAVASLGMLIATKQYAPLFLSLGVGLLRQLTGRVGIAGVTVVAATLVALTVLPFVFWDADRFVFSTLVVPILQPFREDGATVGALLVRLGASAPPTWVGFVIPAVLMVLVFLRAPRTVSGFALGSGLMLLSFFLFSKQAFMNYYFVVMVALLASIASARGDAETGT